MALSFNSATKKWERSTTAPVASSIPKAPAPVQPVKTPVTATQQTDPMKAKQSSIGTVSGTMPTSTPKPTPAVAQPIMTQPITTPEQNQASQQQAYSFIGGPKQPTTPTQPTGTTQPTTPELGTTTPEAPAQDEWVGQSRSEEQALQDNIDKTQEELMSLKNRQDALGQAEYLKKTKELQEYQAKQKEITDKQKAMSEEQAQIQSSRKLQEAQKSLSQLKRNTAYLSSQGLGQSAGALDAFSQQISNAEQVFKEMQQYEQYAEEMRKLGYEFDANAYERGMKEQQDELDKYVSDTIQTIFNNMSAAEMAGQMDTVDEVDAFATKYFNSIDTDIANMTRKQIAIAEQKQALQVQQLAQVKEFVANKSIINKDMSTAQGYYVDGNGSPIISATTGSFIPLPQDPPMEPIRDAKTGKLVSFSLGEDGQIQADVQQVIDQPTFSSNTIQNMVQAVANGTMTVGQAMDVLPPDAQQQFLDKIGSVKPQNDFEFKTVGDQAYSYDPTTGVATPVMGGATGDLRGLANQFPGQARAKNNNPAGITWNSNFDKGTGTAGLLQQAGIRYEKGTARPANEGGNYVTFPTIEEGLAAQRILMTQTYGNSTVQQMLGKWVGTGEALNYAKQVAGNAGVPLNVTVNQLNEQQISALQMAKIQKESPGLAKLLSQGGGNQDEKDTLLSLVKRGGLTKTDQMEIADKALKQGRSKEFNEALKKGAVVDLSDGQITQYNKETDRFLGNAVVKGFEEGLTQFQGLGHALSEKSGPGDMAGVFTFMKTLDPTSVVREAEFENAAKSAGVAERRGNVYDNLTEGKILTSSQAEDFKKIAKVFIEQKAQSYDRLYKNMLNSYDKFGIPQDLAPLKASDQLREYLVSTGQAPQQNTQQPQGNVTVHPSLLGQAR